MDPVARFAQLVGRPSEEVDLGRAALAFAAVADPDVKPDLWLAELDRLADGVADFDALRTRLFSEEGFTGAVDDYHDPENSLLHRVLERRRGIPISLSVVALEVGRRADVPVQGIGAPGHFLIRDPVTGWYCDPFTGGIQLDEAEVRARLVPPASADSRPTALPLPVVDQHQILTRMLANLAHVYRTSGRLAELEWVVRCQHVIPGARVQAALNLGEAHAARGRYRDAACAVLAATRDVGGADEDRLRRAARAFLARLN